MIARIHWRAKRLNLKISNMAKKQAKEKPKYRCRDCAKSYDWHEKSADTGQPFMCRCPHHHDGKFIKFLNDPQCGNFELKDGNTRI